MECDVGNVTTLSYKPICVSMFKWPSSTISETSRLPMLGTACSTARSAFGKTIVGALGFVGMIVIVDIVINRKSQLLQAHARHANHAGFPAIALVFNVQARYKSGRLVTFGLVLVRDDFGGSLCLAGNSAAIAVRYKLHLVLLVARHEQCHVTVNFGLVDAASEHWRATKREKSGAAA